MSWNYRILRHEDGSFALHGVYYDEGGPCGYTAELAEFCAYEEEGSQAIADSLERALRDARERPVLDAADIARKTEQ